MADSKIFEKMMNASMMAAGILVAVSTTLIDAVSSTSRRIAKLPPKRLYVNLPRDKKTEDQSFPPP